MISIKLLVCAVLAAVTLSPADARGSRDRVWHHGGHEGGYDGAHISSAKCVSIAKSSGSIYVQSQAANAVSETAAYVCTKSGYGAAGAAASATAKAYAKAVAEAYVEINCSLKGHAKVMASAYAKAESAAKIWLSAYAKAVSKAKVCSKCKSVATAIAAVKQKVFLHAVAVAHKQVKASTNGGSLDIRKSQHTFEKEVATVVAKAYSEALATNVYKKSKCAAKASAEAKLTKKTKKTRRDEFELKRTKDKCKCAKRNPCWKHNWDSGVKPCCKHGHKCVKNHRWSKKAYCRPAKYGKRRFWGRKVLKPTCDY